MKLDDFGQFLLKLDRNKAPVKARSANIPVWEVENTAYKSQTPSDIKTKMYDRYSLEAMIHWDGKAFWDGVYQWQDSSYEGWTFPYTFPITFPV